MNISKASITILKLLLVCAVSAIFLGGYYRKLGTILPLAAKSHTKPKSVIMDTNGPGAPIYRETTSSVPTTTSSSPSVYQETTSSIPTTTSSSPSGYSGNSSVVPVSSLVPCPVRIRSFEEAVSDQFSHILSLQVDFSRHRMEASELSEQWSTYQHRILIGDVCGQNNMDYLQLTITEEKSPGQLSQGGSAFMVRIQHVYLVVCPVKDYFNGTYSIYCPLYNQRCANVSVLIKHINFSGFNGRTTLLEKMLWTKNVCVDEQVTHGQIGAINPLNLHSKDTQLKGFLSKLPVPQGDGHWLEYQGQWKWVGSQGQLLPLQHNITMCNCFKRFYKTYFLGASHQDINRNCLNNLCPATVLQLNSTPVVEKIIPVLTDILSRVQEDRNESHVYQIIVQMGSWDLNTHHFQDVIHLWIPKLRAAIHALLQECVKLFQSERVKLLVMSSPSLPDAQRIGQTIGPHVSRVVDRNNWISAVLAFTLRKHVQSLPGVEFLDEFEFTFPLYWYVYSWPRYPNHHYCMWSSVRKECPGHVGNAYLGRIASKICPDIVME